jgi:formylglycine-generating enzyme
VPRSFAWITIALAGCLYPDLSEFERCSGGRCGEGANGQGGAGSGAGPNATVTSSNASTASATTTSGGGGGGVPTGPCDLGPGQSGSPGIENPGAPGRCIDIRETTFDEYETFRIGIAASLYDSLPPGEAELCDFKAATPSEYKPWDVLWTKYNNDKTTFGPKPVLGIDWCEARLYCAHAGKMLCGTPTGGVVDTSLPDWGAETELAQACIANTQDPPTSGCVTTQGTCTNSLDCAVAANAGCVGSIGLLHTQSNAVELENNCTDDGPPHSDDKCRLRAFTYADGGTVAQCSEFSMEEVDRGDQQWQGGVRCCWDAQ